MSELYAPNRPEFLTTTEVAELLRVGKHKVLHWIHSGRLRAVNMGGGDATQFIVNRRDVDLLLRELTHTPRDGR
ncbi:MAG: helix-turn-helix domain-containing protein [Pirellulaceae bacterium]